MRLLKNGLGFWLISFLLISACKEKEVEPDIIYKIPDPLREGIKNNKAKYAEITSFKISPSGKLISENYLPYEEYDSLGNVINENKSAWLNNHKFAYDSNGFLKVRYYDGCYTSKEAILYQKTNPFELTEKGYYLKDYKWNSAIDTNNTATRYIGRIFDFYTNGQLKKVSYKSRLNTTYLYDSAGRLATIIDSLDRNGDDYDLPVRKEFIYNHKGKLTQVNELNRSTLLTKANINNKGLIDTIFYFGKQGTVEKLKVYEYKY